MSWRPIAAARQLAESELGAVHKDWGGKIPIVLAYPNRYAVGMSSLAIHGLYKWLNDLPDVVCERAFASWDRRESSPHEPLITLETQRPAREAAAIMFSISFEMDYFNVLAMLRRADIPVRAAERREGDPFVVLGGPAVSANPEPMAAIADAIAIGEAEMMLVPLIETLRVAWDRPRHDTLAAMERLPGMYVPLEHDGHPIARQWLNDLDSYPLASSIVAPKAEFGDMHLIEISRGCGRGCRFCLAGYWYRPKRERSIELILQQAREGLQHRRKIGLVAAAAADYSHIDELAAQLRAMGAQLSVSSLRVAPLSEVLLRALAESDSRSITFAPEAGSERLRRATNKGITHEDILAAVRMAAKHRFESLKLYYMWGLPGETDDDIAALIALTREIRALWPREVVANLTPFVPKAHTPYERFPMASTELLAERLARVQGGLRSARVQVRAEAVDMARIQATLARGDRCMGEALATMSHPSPARWVRALQEANLDPEYYLSAQQRTTLPWGFIDSHVTPNYLHSEAERSKNDQTSLPCPHHGCERCGVCSE